MSKRLEAKITCPNCNHQFDFTLYRSIWGEYPENRDLVMSDRINVATCPSCGVATKLDFLSFTLMQNNFLLYGGNQSMTHR
jgi:transcription elongation factor Elf1